MLFLGDRAVLEQYVQKVFVYIAGVYGSEQHRDGNECEGTKRACFDHCNIQVVLECGTVLQRYDNCVTGSYFVSELSQAL